ncbi:MAG: glycosyltransferase family 4 protein [Bacteroidales bacterium]|nr:glycosyltransferase family 4 protein [Bacteroidales bacterium]
MKKKIIFVTTIAESLSFFQGQLRFLNRYFDVSAVSCGTEKLNNISQREGIVVKNIAMKRRISLWRDIISLLHFVFYFYKEKPFIVHGNTPKASLLSMLAAWILRVPHRIYMCHGLRYQTTTGIMCRLLKVMEKVTCFCATDIYAVSNGVASTLNIDKITTKKVIVVMGGSANGIDLDHYALESSFDFSEYKRYWGIKENDFIFSFLGRVVQDKGINELIEAFGKLVSIHSNIKLLIAGPKEQVNSISSSAAWEIEHNPNIVYMNFQTDVRPILAISNVLVLPSYREGLGMVLLEAGAMNVPCIASDIIGCNDVIVEGVNGLLAKPRDVNSLLIAMEKLFGDRELRERIIKITRKSISERFEQKKIWDAFLNEYLKMK